jgi:hypothetical protein
MAPMSQGRSDMRRAYFAAAVTGPSYWDGTVTCMVGPCPP